MQRHGVDVGVGFVNPPTDVVRTSRRRGHQCGGANINLIGTLNIFEA